MKLEEAVKPLFYARNEMDLGARAMHGASAEMPEPRSKFVKYFYRHHNLRFITLLF